MALDEAAVLGLGSQPISDTAPCGRDVADDEEYMFVDGEVAKLDRIDLGEIDWFQLEQACQSVLRTKSKDVEIACAFGLALFKKERYAGLAAALGLFGELVKNFWNDLFPSRPRRRKSRIESLLERLVDGGWFGREGQPRPDEFDAIDQCVERIEQLKVVLTEKMPDDPPDFGKFTRKIKELAGTRPKAAEPAAPSAGAPSGAPGGGAPAGAGGGGFAAGAVENVSEAVSAILNAATFLRKADATNPVAYAVPRFIKWARIELPATPEAMRQIEPPDKAVAEGQAKLLAESKWEFLLNNAEGAFRSSHPLWLDLQRYVCVALQGLGAPYEKARTAVMDVTGALVRRLGPRLYDLAFRNGTPLCSGETKMWLEAEVAAAQGGGGGRGGAGAGDGKLAEAWEGARKLAGSGKLTEAVKALHDGLLTCSQRRDRFLWRLRIGQLCFDAKRLQLAASLLEECCDEVRRHHIDEWEPTLAAEAAQTLYRCRKALSALEKQPTPEVLGGVRESFAWLCQLDPLAALAAEPAGQ